MAAVIELAKDGAKVYDLCKAGDAYMNKCVYMWLQPCNLASSLAGMARHPWIMLAP